MRWWAAGLAGLVALLVAVRHEYLIPPVFVRSLYDDGYEVISGRASHWRCQIIELERDGTSDYISTPSRRCYRFGPPRRMKGLFTYGMETSFFDELGHKQVRSVGPMKTWLSFDDQSDLRSTPELKSMSGSVWLLDFIGRKTARPSQGGYGHLGMSDADILVDQMISARQLSDIEAREIRERISSDNPR